MSTPLVKYEQHPRGMPGARKSILKTVQAAAAGRLDPKVAAWAQRKLVEAGATARTDKAAQARALLSAIRREKFWVPDPVDGERIAIPACLLADCNGLTFDGGDCDDLSAALAAALESVGIVAAIVGQAFDLDGNYQHVLVACEVADGEWYYADPSEPLPFGNAMTPTKEVWRLVPSGRVLCEHAPSCSIPMRGVHAETNDRMVGDAIYVGDMGDTTFEDAWKNAGSGADDYSADPIALHWGWYVFGAAVTGLAVYGAYKAVT